MSKIKRVLLTAAFCAEAKAPAKGRVEYQDKAAPGLRFRVSATGTRSFTLLYRQAGEQKRATWQAKSHSLKAAREAAAQVLRQVSEGGRPAAPMIRRRKAKPGKPAALLARRVVIATAAAQPVSVGELADLYIERYLRRAVRQPAQPIGEVENHVKPRIGHLRVGEITRAHIRAMTADIVEEGFPVSANRILARTRAMFAWAISQDLFLLGDPTSGVAKPTKEKTRDRILAPAELARVWLAADRLGYPARDYTRLMILSGLRRREGLQAEWREIDLVHGEDWLIPARRMKNGAPHLVPLTGGMIELLAGLPFRDRGGFVFSASDGSTCYANLDKPLRALIAASGVEDWSWHDLRRTVRSGLPALGVAREIAERVIGHTVGGQLDKVYDLYLYRAEKLDALERWDRHVRALVARELAAGGAVPAKAAG